MDDIVRFIECPEGKYRITLYESGKLPEGYLKLEVSFETEFNAFFYVLKRIVLPVERMEMCLKAVEDDFLNGRYLPRLNSAFQGAAINRALSTGARHDHQ